MPHSLDHQGLLTVRAFGSGLVHLADLGEPRSLCGRSVAAGRPPASFRHRGCRSCLHAARALGRGFVREGRNALINLQRVSTENLPATD